MSFASEEVDKDDGAFGGVVSPLFGSTLLIS